MSTLEFILKVIEILMTTVVGALVTFYVWRRRKEYLFTEESKRLEVQKEQEDLSQQAVNNKHVYDRITSMMGNYKACFISTAKLHNGITNSDNSHQWKYSFKIAAICEELRLGAYPNIKDEFYNRPLEDAPKLFGELKSLGFAYCPNLEEWDDAILQRKLSMLGIKSFCVASTNDMKDFIFIFWFKDSEDLLIDKALGQSVLSDFKSLSGLL